MKKLFGLLLITAIFLLSNFFSTEYIQTTEKYIVKEGDTIWYIAGQYFNKEEQIRHFGEFQWQICEKNRDKFNNERALKPGDVILIPLNKKVNNKRDSI